MATRKTMLEWMLWLNDDKRALTRDEFDSCMLMNIREYTRQIWEYSVTGNQRSEHIEKLLSTAVEGAEQAAHAQRAALAAREPACREPPTCPIPSGVTNGRALP